MAEFILGNSLRKLARESGPLQRLLWRLDFALIWVLITLFSAVPVDAASRLGDRVGRWIGPKLKRKSLTFKENIAVAFPELSATEVDDLATRAWGRAGRILAEYSHLATIGADPDRLTIDIRQPIITYSDPTRPCVFIASHQSNWEVIAFSLARLGIPSAILYSPPTNPHLDRMLLESRRALGCELLPRKNSTRALMRALKNGRSIGMVADRRIDEGENIRFFGHDKPSTIMPAWLALKFDCDLVPVHIERLEDARYQVTMHPPVKPSMSGADMKAEAIDMTQQVHHYFEEWVRQHPEDWFCSKRLWPKNDPVAPIKAPVETKVNNHAV